ncbi:Jag family protein [Bifidobacterium sp. ESL0825]|uniref:Jag family protein n=1 Tax=Bifidobacterium sp. ESL0825 TaxID=3448587 RepID=UPI00404136F5
MSQSLDQGKTIEQLNEEADVAADYLEGLLDIVDYEGDIEMGVRNHRPTVQIVADDDTDIKHLIGKDGEVVDALQQLTRLAVQQKIGERSHLIVDVDGFLRRKREHLREQALDVIDEVRETGDPVNMKPMNSFERKIVHDMVREEGLKSRSHGEEPHRYVTVYLKAKNEDEDLSDDVEDEPVGYDAPLDSDETDQTDDSADYAADDDPAGADRE